MTTFKHTHFAKAWLEGVEIQYLEEGVWKDLPKPCDAHRFPSFYIDKEYRYKPINLRYRIALTRVGGIYRCKLANDLEQERNISALPSFVKWLTNWTEVVG